MARENRITNRQVAVQADAATFPNTHDSNGRSVFRPRLSAHLLLRLGAGTMSPANLARIKSFSAELQGCSFRPALVA
jgi:hypothetical protein